MRKAEYIAEAVDLLSSLIATPRVSRDEKKATDIMQEWMEERGYLPIRIGNNLLLKPADFSPERPTVLLNAHIDTVKAVASWTTDPYIPVIEGDKLYGLGANDCGGGLVTLLQIWRKKTEESLPYNLVYLASCEEEVSGAGGIRMVIPELTKILSDPRPVEELISVAIVGEPTGMQPAVAEKGLMVIDMVTHGKSGHAARNEGENALYKAIEDIRWIRDYKFEKISPFLGETRMQLTVINSGTQHNVVPDECRMIVDVRSNEYYTNEEIFDLIDKNTTAECKARSFHLRSSAIPVEHPLIKRCIDLGLQPFGSPTLSDQALMPWPSFKLGPGQSSRSHSANEFICISELQQAFDIYDNLLSLGKSRKT